MENQLETIRIQTDQLVLGHYAIKSGGIFRYNEMPSDEGKETQPELICLTPMYPTAILENIDTKEQRIELTYAGRNHTETVILDRETLVNKNKVVSLARYGIAVGSVNASKVAAFFTTVLGQSAAKLPRKLAKSSLGWVGKKHDYFLPYSDGFVLDQMDQAVTDLLDAMKPHGDETAWFERMKQIRRSIPVRIAMAAAFASPLIAIVGQNPFVTHIWGGTGLGKTLLLKVTMSIYGNPNSTQIVRSLNCTENSLMQQASFLQNLPLAGDELQTIKTRYDNYDKLIMDMTEGVNRGRLGPDAKQQRVMTWRNAILTCGEEPIVKQDSGGGVFARVVEIELLQPYVKDGNELANFVADNYGFAGPKYISTLMLPVALGGYDIKMIYRDMFSKLMRSGKLNEKQAGAGALIMAADWIASSMFWQGESELTVEDVSQFLKSAETVDVAERAYKAVCGMVARYKSNFSDDSKECWGQLDGGAAYIIKSVLSEQMLKMGFDWEACKKKWDENGYIIKSRQGRYQHYKSIGGVATYCILLRLPVEEEQNGELPF